MTMTPVGLPTFGGGGYSKWLWNREWDLVVMTTVVIVVVVVCEENSGNDWDVVGVQCFGSLVPWRCRAQCSGCYIVQL